MSNSRRYRSISNLRPPSLRIEPLEDRRLLATFSVSNLLDGPVSASNVLPGSLRQAIFDANANPGADNIVFGKTSGSILLAAGQLEITDEVEINGPGHEQLAIDGGNQSTVFYIAGTASGGSPVSIRGVTITNGLSMSQAGGIHSEEELTIDNCYVTQNVGTTGGVDSTRLVVTNSTIHANTGEDAGGIQSFRLVVRDSTISSNTASIDSNSIGGIDALVGSFSGTGGEATISSSVIENNQGGATGGVLVGARLVLRDSIVSGNIGNHSGGVHSTGQTFVNSSLIANNVAGLDGGGIHLADGVIVNSTITGNVGQLYGGGISHVSFSSQPGSSLAVIVANSTVTNNRSIDGPGAGISSAHSSRLMLFSSIVSGNVGPDLDIFNAPPCARSFSLGHNIIGTGTVADDPASCLAPTDSVGITNPQLTPLQDNGGQTLTHAPLFGSPAIDAGDPNQIPGSTIAIQELELEFDIPFTGGRGVPFTRMFGGRMDIGAVEHNDGARDFDFNDDALYDCGDIDALVAEIADESNLASFDLNGDEIVDRLDRDAWLAFAAVENGNADHYRLGDANLDGIVDGADFLAWSQNKFTSLASWCGGDFNADGHVDGHDFLIWNQNKTAVPSTSPTVAMRSRLEPDAGRAQSTSNTGLLGLARLATVNDMDRIRPESHISARQSLVRLAVAQRASSANENRESRVTQTHHSCRCSLDLLGEKHRRWLIDGSI